MLLQLEQLYKYVCWHNRSKCTKFVATQTIATNVQNLKALYQCFQECADK